MSLVERVQAILTKPKTTRPAILAEPGDARRSTATTC